MPDGDHEELSHRSAVAKNLASVDAIDAQIQNKIGLLESLLGSCDGVLRRHDEAAQDIHNKVAAQPGSGDVHEALAQRSHPGNPVPLHFAAAPPLGVLQRQDYVLQDSLLNRESSREHVPESRTRPSQQTVVRPVAQMVEAARLLRAQRILCNVTRQLCGAHHVNCCLSSLRIHRLAEKQIRHAVAVKFGR